MRQKLRLTRALESQITADWQRELPTLTIYTPRRLLRRVGPLLVGITLDRDSGGDKYKPTFHVHCLAVESDCVYLQLATQMINARSGGPSFIRLSEHAAHYAV